MSTPLAIQFTEEQLQQKARQFLVDNYGPPMQGDPEATDRWHERFGMLCHFAGTLFEDPCTPSKKSTKPLPPEN